jgi:hypothetical protein
MRGRWAAGIVPRNFAWIIKGHLAVSERPGGSAPVHRRVRRHEEILWLRGQGFTKIVSLLPSPHNLHAYDELGMAHEHIPMAIHDDPLPTLVELYPSLLRWLYGGERILVHQDQLDERLAGVLGGFLYWSGMVPALPLAISAIENLLRRQLGSTGRTVATLAIEIPAPTGDDRRRPERPSDAVLTAIAEGRLGPVVEMPRPVRIDEPDEIPDAVVVEEEVADVVTIAEPPAPQPPARPDRSRRPAAKKNPAVTKAPKRPAAKSRAAAKKGAARRVRATTRSVTVRKAATKSSVTGSPSKITRSAAASSSGAQARKRASTTSAAGAKRVATPRRSSSPTRRVGRS